MQALQPFYLPNKENAIFGKEKKKLKTYFSLSTIGGQRWSRYKVLNF